MTALIDQVKRTLAERKLADAESPVVLMVSGGSDSTALAYIAKELADEKLVGPLAIVHINHQLRGKEADEDAEFVATLAEELGIPYFGVEVDVAAEAKRTGENVEAVGRRERYSAAQDALRSLCMHEAAPTSSGRIFTAHTQDDRVENFYMRSIVGTGPGGFRSMLYRNGPVVRPLLDVSREDLRDYIEARARVAQAEGEGADGEAAVAVQPVVCDEQGNLWREDATNAHTDRFRAFVRHEIIPKAKERNPQLLDTLCRSMNLVGDEDDMLDAQTNDLADRVVAWHDVNDDGIVDYEAGCLLLPQFGALPLPLQRRIVFQVLGFILGSDARVETATIATITDGFKGGAPISGYTNNIQGNLALSANKNGLLIEPMEAYRVRRKRG